MPWEATILRKLWNGVFAVTCFGLIPFSMLAIAADVCASLKEPTDCEATTFTIADQGFAPRDDGTKQK